MISEQDRQEEALLDARIELENLVFVDEENAAARYCQYIKVVAKKYNVTEMDLSVEFMRHCGSSFGVIE